MTYLLDGGIVPLVEIESTGAVDITVAGQTIEQIMLMHQRTTTR